MTPTPSHSEHDRPRRHVVGFILGSMVVGVIGLVTAMTLTVSGIMTTFTDVSATYEDIFDTGIEVGPIATPVELENANYAVLSFPDREQQPASTDQAQACAITDQYGDPVATETSTQPVSKAELTTSNYDLADVNHVISTHFEASQGTYAVSCQQFGLLTDGASNTVGATTLWGVSVGIGSVLLAAGLLMIGLVNHSRNKAAVDKRPRKLIQYRLDDS